MIREFITVDLETLGIREGAPVLSASAVYIDMSKFDDGVPFEEYIKDPKHSFHMILDTEHQPWTVPNKDTLAFWENELASSNPAQKELLLGLFGGKTLPSEFVEAFTAWVNSVVKNMKSVKVFERGCGFDTGKIERIFEEVGAKVPYAWWNYREIRTWIDAKKLTPPFVTYPGSTNWDPEFLEGLGLQTAVKHHSLHDAVVDAYCIAALEKSGY